MSRVEFMRQLESLLQNISEAERVEALQYYNNYFDDAGPENEQDVIEALGNPAKVAENIKQDISGGNGVPRSSGSERAVIQYQQNMVKPCEPEKNGLPTWAVVLIVILCVFASPIILSVAAGGVSLALGLIVAWFALIFSAGITAVALLVVMVILVVVGFMCISVSPLTGIGLLGGGLLCGGIAILFLMLTVAMAGIVTPAIVGGIVSLFRKKEKSQKNV